MLSNFSCLSCHLLTVSKLAFSSNSSRKIIRVTNSWDQHKAQNFVGPDLGPNCFKGYQQMTKVSTSRERVNIVYRDWMSLYRGSFMSAHVLWNLLNMLRKSDINARPVIKCEACQAFYHFFATSLIN